MPALAVFFLTWSPPADLPQWVPPPVPVLQCLEPLKPLLPLRPVWCSGQWTQILECDQLCNCVWRPVCIQ